MLSMPEPTALQIALLTHSINPRGGVVHTLELGGALRAAGHAVTIIAPATGSQRLFRETPCAVDSFDLPTGATNVADIIRTRINAYIEHLTAGPSWKPRYGEFDVMHAQDGISGNALATLSERGLISGFIRTVHHVDHHRDAQINAWEERAIRGAQQLCCVSGHWQDALMRDYGVRSSIVSNGVDLNRFTPRSEPTDTVVAQRLGLSPDAPLVVSIGGIEERKNTIRILEAFIQLRRQWPHAQLAIVGGASLLDHSHYRTQFASILNTSGLSVGARRDVVITGVLADIDMPAVLRLARVVAFPSLREGFGLVVLESLASGTPTVVSNIAPFTEYLSTNDAHWADPLDCASITSALAAAIATPKFHPPEVCRRFNWAASAVRHIGLYREFLHAHARLRRRK
jgi:glycosyltransferase-like protein